MEKEREFMILLGYFEMIAEFSPQAVDNLRCRLLAGTKLRSQATRQAGLQQ